ncbi:related to MDR1 - Mac1p interacting protein [Melanopsichium pennsylvanicum]|uniref:Related to MDR1 - Mac1p interacting protein n=2 Tax=Melanopsichium pennsylvanicum TaxID=63383 RepID=A0AAJ4XMW1_9BASI|nr:related to MDR1-Mac1p interacting protein [Melanopsichium pennsylvanicum 4]SNX84762.1 related to MDR1 - Mac1p interacting protein [Melanopsichium pennsylvanicum]
MDAHTLNAWTRFALQKGGIGTCIALIDNPATEPEDLMFMAGEKITVLRRLDDDASDAPTTSTSAKRRSDAIPDSEAWFLGYCEGVVGRFKGAHVQFHGRLKKPVLMRRSAAGSIRDSSMRPMSKSEAAKMHLSQVPAGIPFTAVNSDGEEDAMSPVDRRQPALLLPTQTTAASTSSDKTHSAAARAPHPPASAAPVMKNGRFGLTTPPPSDEGHLRKQAVPRTPAVQDNDEDSDDSTSLLPWARHSRESSAASSSSPAARTAALSARTASLVRPSAPVRTSSAFTHEATNNLPTIHHLPPSPISSSESPDHAESSVALPAITTTLSSGSNSRSGNMTVTSTTASGSSAADIASRTSCTSSNYTTSTNEDSDDEQGQDNRRRDYTFSIYDVYGRDSVAFPNFDFRQHGSKSSLNKLAASKSAESLGMQSQHSSGIKDDRLHLPPSLQQRPQHSSQEAQHPQQQQAGPPRRPGQLTVPAATDSSIPFALRSPSGRRPSAAPDPRMAGAPIVRAPSNIASSLRRQVETPPAATAAQSVSPLDAAGAALIQNTNQVPRGPVAFDPRRRPSLANIAAAGPPPMHFSSLPPIFTSSQATSTASNSNSGLGSHSGSSPQASADTMPNDSNFSHRPGFAEARSRRRSMSVGTLNKVENLVLVNEANTEGAHAPLSPITRAQHNDVLSSATPGRPSFRTSASSSRSRNGQQAQATSPGLGPVRASSDRLSERERAHSGVGSGLLRKNPSNPTPGLHGGSGLHGLSPMARSTSPMSQLSAPSPTDEQSRRTSAASTSGYSTNGPRSPALRSPLGMMPPAPNSAPVTPGGGPGPTMNGFISPNSPNSMHIPGGMMNGFDAMGFMFEPNVPPCMPQIDDPELKKHWLTVLKENDFTAAKKSRKVKKLVRTGVPPSLRREVWLFLANASVRRRPGLFEQLCKTSQGTKGKRGKEEAYETIEKDLHRTLPDHRLFMGENATGRADLEGILKSYVHFNPMLGYTQGMGLLAGFALIQMPAEDAFWLLCAVLRNPQMEEYYSAGMKQLHVDSVILSNLLSTMDPELHARFEQAGLSSIMFTPNWFLPLFTRVLPWATLVRVWDVFFYEGPTWMLRVALAIVRILREQLMDHRICPTAGEMLQLLLHPPPHSLTVENVLNCAFSVTLKDGEMRKLSRTASKLVREKNFLNQPADARGRAGTRKASGANGSKRSTSAPARR